MKLYFSVKLIVFMNKSSQRGVINKPSKFFKALFFLITLLQFLKVIDWKNLTDLLCDCEQNCFYDILWSRSCEF